VSEMILFNLGLKIQPNRWVEKPIPSIAYDSEMPKPQLFLGYLLSSFSPDSPEYKPFISSWFSRIHIGLHLDGGGGYRAARMLLLGIRGVATRRQWQHNSLEAGR
jgi:hypothetical protein